MLRRRCAVLLMEDSGLAVLNVTAGLAPLVGRADDGVLKASAGLIYGQTLGE